MKRYLLYPTQDQEKLIQAFLETNDITFLKEEEEKLPDYVLAGIKKGQEDIQAGRVITHQEFKKRTVSSR